MLAHQNIVEENLAENCGDAKPGIIIPRFNRRMNSAAHVSQKSLFIVKWTVKPRLRRLSVSGLDGPLCAGIDFFVSFHLTVRRHSRIVQVAGIALDSFQNNEAIKCPSE